MVMQGWLFFFNMVKNKEKKNQSIAFSIVMQDLKENAKS